MAIIGFTVVERFHAGEGDRWAKYLEWSQLNHLKETITLDTCLCPPVLKKLSDSDWPHVLPEGPIYGMFSDLRWTESRVPPTPDTQLLAVIRDPQVGDVNHSPRSDFEFAGYDLIEDQTQISALLNCGGFEKAFKPSDLSECGLIREYERAREVQGLLSKLYPEEPHADCTLYAIWRRR